MVARSFSFRSEPSFGVLIIVLIKKAPAPEAGAFLNKHILDLKGVVMQRIDWKKLGRQIHRQVEPCQRDLANTVLSFLPELANICGESTQAPTTLKEVAHVLIFSHCAPIIAVPCCRDHSGRAKAPCEADGRPLAQKHSDFLSQIATIIPGIKPCFLVADQEVNDSTLVAASGKTKEEFLEDLSQSFQEVRNVAEKLGWKAQFFSDFIPDLINLEKSAEAKIANDPSLVSRIQHMTRLRQEMYQRVHGAISQEEMVKRTIKTAAQYRVLGEYARQESMLICNHTTPNLAWYEAGVLHNPVGAY